jgi:hypothetical protein
MSERNVVSFTKKGQPEICRILTVSDFPYHVAQEVPGAEPSKAWVCSRSPTGIAGSNPAEGMDVCCVVYC